MQFVKGLLKSIIENNKYVHKVQFLVKTNLKYFFKFINYRKDNNVIPTLMSYDPATADNE